MKKTHLPVLFLAVLAIGASSCAPTIPNSFQPSRDQKGVPRGAVIALAASKNAVVVATPSGLFRRASGGDWNTIELPASLTPRRITALALSEEELFAGTSGDGLHVLAGGSWRVLTSSNGAIPDDNVLCLAIEGEDEGLPGRNIWVGTKKGFGLRRDGVWEVFSPEGKWLADVSENSPPDMNDFIDSGFRLGKTGEDKRTFRPPVTAVAVGQDRVVLGSNRSRLAVLSAEGFSTVQFDGDMEVNSLLVGPSSIWCGTSEGLFWGGLRGQAEGSPYPQWRGSHYTRSVLYKLRNSTPFAYVWHLVGYNIAGVADLARDDRGGLWVAFVADDTGIEGISGMIILGPGPDIDRSDLEPSTSLRRYGNIEEYFTFGSQPHYEVYGKQSGVRGDPVAFAWNDDGLWVGTTSGLLNFR